MKLIKQNKPLFLLLITLLAYVMIVILFINPLITKNSELEERRSQILISQQEKEYIVFIHCISYFSIDFKNKMSTIIISKDWVCRNIVFGSPIHLNSSENLTSYNSIKGWCLVGSVLVV